jgi:hypothetical protein
MRANTAQMAVYSTAVTSGFHVEHKLKFFGDVKGSHARE